MWGRVFRPARFPTNTSTAAPAESVHVGVDGQHETAQLPLRLSRKRRRIEHRQHSDRQAGRVDAWPEAGEARHRRQRRNPARELDRTQPRRGRQVRKCDAWPPHDGSPRRQRTVRTPGAGRQSHSARRMKTIRDAQAFTTCAHRRSMPATPVGLPSAAVRRRANRTACFASRSSPRGTRTRRSGSRDPA